MARIVGVLLVIVGLVAFLFGGFQVTRSHKVAQVGGLKAYQQRHETVALPPILGVIALAGGVLLIATGSRRGEVL